MLAPMLVQMERQIDREIAADNKANGGSFGSEDSDISLTMKEQRDEYDLDTDDEEDYNEPMLMYGPQPQIITNDLKSLDEMVCAD
jgi:growth arrest-specific protein 2